MTSAGCCDLHMHSTQSDGTDSPTTLVRMAAEIGLGAIALTDHDTFSGIEEAKQEGTQSGVRVISGVEISVEYGSKTVHMLGYRFDSGAERLRAGLAQILEGREKRNREIVSKLNALGVEIAYEEICKEAGGRVVGRPHFAAVMLRHGYIETRQEAFDKYLAKGAAAYVDRLRFTPEDSVAMIRESGGIAVLAHPKLLPLQQDETLDDVLRKLVDAGLQGLECWYSLHSPEETREYLDLAKKYNLIVTGGSDFHGGVKPEIRLGTGLGTLCVPISCADAILEA